MTTFLSFLGLIFIILIIKSIIKENPFAPKAIRRDGIYVLEGAGYITAIKFFENGNIGWVGEFAFSETLTDKILTSLSMNQSLNNPDNWAKKIIYKGNTTIAMFLDLTNNKKAQFLDCTPKGDDLLEVIVTSSDDNNFKYKNYYSYKFIHLL